MRGTKGKGNLLKMVVTSKTVKNVDGSIQEKETAKSFYNNEREKRFMTDTDDNVSINSHVINKKGSNSNNGNNNINSVNNCKEMNIDNNGCKINDNKSDDSNNLDTKNNISKIITSITNTAATTITLITKVRDKKQYK